MRAVPASFEVCGWSLTPSREVLTRRYRVEHPTLGRWDLDERIELPAAVPDDGAFGRIADLLAVAAGVSYFKVSAPDVITYGPGIRLDAAATAAAVALYDEGMREFSFTNDLPVPRPIGLPHPSAEASARVPAAGGRLLIPIGAGRDSSLLASILAEHSGEPPLLLAIGDNQYARRVAEAVGLELLVAHRHLDPGLLELNAHGAMNGHVPVTAINSLIAAVVAHATGCGSVVMANERSGSQPTRIVHGVAINHQYSKSFEFELLLQRALAGYGVRYFSALRPWGELPVAAAFAGRGDAVLHAFMSCNRAFVRDPARRSDGWCGDCPKCRSVFLSLAPFLPPAVLGDVFRHDLLADPSQIAGFLALVDADAKPFECVGEVDEARTAFRMLAADPAWRDHAVVRAVDAPTPSADDAFAVAAEHAVPAEALATLRAVIGPAPGVRGARRSGCSADRMTSASSSTTRPTPTPRRPPLRSACRSPRPPRSS